MSATETVFVLSNSGVPSAPCFVLPSDCNSPPPYLDSTFRFNDDLQLSDQSLKDHPELLALTQEVQEWIQNFLAIIKRHTADKMGASLTLLKPETYGVLTHYCDGFTYRETEEIGSWFSSSKICGYQTCFADQFYWKPSLRSAIEDLAAVLALLTYFQKHEPLLSLRFNATVTDSDVPTHFEQKVREAYKRLAEAEAKLVREACWQVQREAYNEAAQPWILSNLALQTKMDESEAAHRQLKLQHVELIEQQQRCELENVRLRAGLEQARLKLRESEKKLALYQAGQQRTRAMCERLRGAHRALQSRVVELEARENRRIALGVQSPRERHLQDYIVSVRDQCNQDERCLAALAQQVRQLEELVMEIQPLQASAATCLAELSTAGQRIERQERARVDRCKEQWSTAIVLSIKALQTVREQLDSSWWVDGFFSFFQRRKINRQLGVFAVLKGDLDHIQNFIHQEVSCEAICRQVQIFMQFAKRQLVSGEVGSSKRRMEGVEQALLSALNPAMMLCQESCRIASQWSTETQKAFQLCAHLASGVRDIGGELPSLGNCAEVFACLQTNITMRREDVAEVLVYRERS